ncbi:macrophage mannose receptor 1-like isoform X2 [Lepisosteus oculatus]
MKNDRVLFLLLAQSALVLASEVRTFHLLKENRSFTAARQNCQARYKDLGIFRTASEARDVLQLANISQQRRVWIGGVYNRSEWRWVNKERMNFPCSPQYASNNKTVLCGTIDPVTEMWNLEDCGNAHLSVCLDVQRTLYVISQKREWKDALSYCRTNYTDLLSIADVKDQKQLEETLQKHSLDKVWLGLKKHMAWQQWYWTNEQVLEYQLWAEGQPSHPLDELCGAAQKDSRGNFYWYDSCCYEQLPFVCY